MKVSKNRKLILLLGIITLLFLLVVFYLVYFQLFKANYLNNDIRNARNYSDESNVKRGNIYDKNGTLLTYSEKVNDTYKRFNEYNHIYSNIIGYSHNRLGKSNIEAYYNRDLLNITNNADIFTRLDSIVDDSAKSDLYLTIDNDIQRGLWEIFGNNKGSLIVAKPKTGEIVSLITKPTFNVNRLEENWSEIISSEDGVLLNRATQGMYEPGSIFKVLTSVAFLRSGIDLNYNDTGTAQVADYSVENFGGASYGEMDLEKALSVSSNTYFFEKSTQVSNKIFTDTIYDFGIGRNYDLPLTRNTSKFPFRNGLSDLEKANAAYGQGETYVTPMDMLLVAMGIANDGVVYQPKIVEKVDRNGITQTINSKVLSNDIESEFAKTIREYLKSTAEYNDYQLRNGISLAGKTGTAESSENNNLWYLGMAPAENPEYVIIVTIENSTSTAGRVAAPIAVEALNYIFSR